MLYQALLEQFSLQHSFPLPGVCGSVFQGRSFINNVPNREVTCLLVFVCLLPPTSGVEVIESEPFDRLSALSRPNHLTLILVWELTLTLARVGL